MKPEIIERIVALEWAFFQETENEGGRAACQDDYPTFYIMRSSQAMAWPEELADSWLRGLEAARAAGRNPVAEKYARMMASTAPEAYKKLEPQLPELSEEVLTLARRITDRVVLWQEELAARFPHFAARARPIRSSQDSEYVTSAETYLYGELLTCTPETLRLFSAFCEEKAARGENLSIEIEQTTVRQQGYASLEDAEARLAALDG